MLIKHVIAFKFFQIWKNMLTGERYVSFFRIDIWLCLNKVNRRLARYCESIFSRRLLFMRAMNKKELERMLRTVNLEKCSSCNLFWWYSVVAIERISRGCVECQNFSSFASISKASRGFILDLKELKAHIRWTCKSSEELFKTLSRVIYCNCNSWCKTHRIKCVEEIYADVKASLQSRIKSWFTKILINFIDSF